MTYFTFHTFLNFLRTHYKKEKTSRPKEKSTYTDQFFFNSFLPEDKGPKSKATVSNYSNGKSHPYIDDWDINALCLDDMESVILEFIPAKISDKKKASDFKELKSLMLSSQNIIDDAVVNHEITQIDDLFSLLYYAFVYLYNNQKKIFDKYSYEEITSSWQISETHKSDSKTSNANSITDKSPRTPAIITALSAISDYMYQKILSNESRYHSAHIDHTLLSFGKVTVENRSMEDPNENTLMHYFDSSKKNLYIYGPGGIGKTTFLITLMKQYHECKDNYIPLYLSLADLKKYANSTYDEDDQSTSCISAALWDRFKKCKKDITGDNAVAINRYTEDSFKDLLNKIMQHASSSHKILLLLDGINEISIEKNSYIRSRLMEEMQQLSGFTNIRIIATTRPFPIIENDFLRNCISIEATGIETKLLFKILDINKLSIPDDELLSILKVPLFLNMYISVQKQNRTNASTRGAILYDFYNNIASQYNEKSHDRQLQKNDPDRHTVIPLILDFILPAFAARMEMEDCFTLPKSIFHDIIENRKAYIKPFIHQSNNIISKIYPDEEYLEDAIEEIPNAKTVLKIVRDQLSLFTVYSDINEELSFTHQYIRDYFASIFRLTAIGSCSFDDNSVYADYLSHVLSPETLELSNEILNYSEIYNNPLIIDKAFKQSAFSDQPMILKNLLDQLSAYYKNDLSTYHFKGIDFSRQQMSNYQFYNYAQKKAATFSNCIFSDESFDTYNGHKTILHTIGFSKRPVLCELSIGDMHTYYKLIDLISKSVLSTYIIDSIFSNAEDTDYNALITSEDLRYLLVTAASSAPDHFTGRRFYIYDCQEDKLHEYTLPNATYITFRFIGDRLFYMSNYKKLYELNLTSNTLEEYNIPDILQGSKSSTHITNTSDNSIMQNILMEIDETGNILIHKDFPFFTETIYYYNRKKETVFNITLSSKEFDTVNKSPYKKGRISISDGFIYILLHSSICKRELIPDGKYETIINNLNTQKDDQLLVINGKAILLSDFNASIYDIESRKKETTIAMKILDDKFVFYYNKQYIILEQGFYYDYTQRDNLHFCIIMLDKQTSINTNHICRSALTNSVVLSNKEICLCYNRRYLPIIKQDTLAISDCVVLPDSYILNSMQYCSNNNMIALVTQTITSNDTLAQNLMLYKEGMYSSPVFTYHEYSLLNKYCFSEDGKYFFMSNVNENYVEYYRTDDFSIDMRISIKGILTTIIPTLHGVDIIYKPAKDYEYINQLLLYDSNDYYCLRITFDSTGYLRSHLYSVPILNTEEISSTMLVQYLRNNIFMITCPAGDVIDIPAEVDALDPDDESVIYSYDFEDFQSFYFVSQKKYYSDDLIKNDFLVKNTNNRHYFYRRDMKCKGISIPGMKIDDNCHFDKEHNRFLGESQKGIFTAIDLDTRSRVAEATFSIGMMIKDCRFINCKFENSYTRTIIENNGGIIED